MKRTISLRTFKAFRIFFDIIYRIFTAYSEIQLPSFFRVFWIVYRHLIKLSSYVHLYIVVYFIKRIKVTEQRLLITCKNTSKQKTFELKFSNNFEGFRCIINFTLLLYTSLMARLFDNLFENYRCLVRIM